MFLVDFASMDEPQRARWLASYPWMLNFCGTLAQNPKASEATKTGAIELGKKTSEIKELVEKGQTAEAQKRCDETWAWVMR